VFAPIKGIGGDGVKKFDPVEAWLDNVAYSHSGSKSTEQNYRHQIKIFCEFIGSTPSEILEDYEESNDREFRRKYARYLRALISNLYRKGYAVNAVKAKVAALKSFFKYNDLPLGYVPMARKKITYHNRDITREEIINILKISRPRDRAFFCIMAQTGLRPGTLCSIKLKHIQPDFEKGAIPCKIDVSAEIAKGEYRSYFTFMSPESVKHLKAYLATRGRIALEDYVFTSHGTKKRAHPRSMSQIFVRAIESLKEKGLMDFQQKREGRPRTVRLYNLRKFFRKYAHQAGFEIAQFWMGHTVSQGQEEHYRPKDPEFHRQLYAEKAMPFLRLETATPTEMDKIISAQQKEIDTLKAEKLQMAEEIKHLKNATQQIEKRLRIIEIVHKHGFEETEPGKLKELLKKARTQPET